MQSWLELNRLNLVDERLLAGLNLEVTTANQSSNWPLKFKQLRKADHCTSTVFGFQGTFRPFNILPLVKMCRFQIVDDEWPRVVFWRWMSWVQLAVRFCKMHGYYFRYGQDGNNKYFFILILPLGPRVTCLCLGYGCATSRNCEDYKTITNFSFWSRCNFCKVVGL